MGSQLPKLSLFLPVLLLVGFCAEFNSQSSFLGVTLLGAGGAGSGSTSSVPADWWDENWSRRKLLTFDNSSRGALVNLPVLVKLDSSRVDYSLTASDGSDVCFVESDGAAGAAPLSHEIEQWNASGTSVIWLNVPALSAASASDAVYMYYGGSTCSTTATSAWNSDYQAVWHLNASVNDSTANANHLVDTGTSDTTGQFANGRGIAGTGDQLEDADGENYINGQSALTFSAWVRANSTGTNDMGIFYTDSPAGADSFPGLRHDQTGASGGCTSCYKGSINAASSIVQMESTSSVQSTSWAHVTMVWSSSNQIQFYLNGALDTPTYNDTAVAGVLTGATTVIVGRGGKDNTGATSWDGVLDEVRISSAAASADWVDAQYKSMTDALISYGSEESL